MQIKSALLAVALAIAGMQAQAECLTDKQVADLIASYVAKTPAANPEGLSEEDGACSRAKVNLQLAQRLGKVVGYKAWLTNPAVQKRFGYDNPTWCKLYQGM